MQRREYINNTLPAVAPFLSGLKMESRGERRGDEPSSSFFLGFEFWHSGIGKDSTLKVFHHVERGPQHALVRTSIPSVSSHQKSS